MSEEQPDIIIIEEEEDESDGVDLAVLDDEEEDKLPIGTVEEAEYLFFLETRNSEKTADFTPQGDESEHDNLPVEGKGRVNTIMIRAEDPQFDIILESDEKDIIDDSFQTLKDIQDGLDFVSAYDDNGEHVVVISDYPFIERLNVVIRVRGEIVFSRIRVEAIVEDFE